MQALSTIRPAVPFPGRPPRDARLDLLRGWMQLSIFISHAAGSVFAWGIHAAWGLSDSSEQFLFLSGFGLGSVFALKAARAGQRGALRDLFGRTRRLWFSHVAVLLGLGALVLTLDRIALSGEGARMGWSWLLEDPPAALAAA